MITHLAHLPYLHDARSGSKTYRRLLLAVAIFAALRLLVQFGVATSEEFFPDDLRIYLDAARDLRDERDLYPPLPLEHMEFYQYPPAFALVMEPWLWMPDVAVALIHTALHAVIYLLLYLSWDRIFRQLGMERGRELLAWTLPVWLIFAGFWADMNYLNVYILTALLATLLVEAILHERMGQSLLWLSIILQIKPQWAFAALIPLLLGRYRFFGRLIVLAVIVYAAVTGITALAVGPEYGWNQTKDYANLLTRIGDDYPWRGPDEPYLGYNHSIPQIMVFVFGIKDSVLDAALLVRIALLVPLAVVLLRLLRSPIRQAGRDRPLLSLDLFFALYTAVFIWLEVVWELSLGIALFTYLLATTDNRSTRRWIWIVFLPYALVDVIQVFTYGILGDAGTDPGPYILTDPSIYLPVIMITTVFFHALLVRRLWVTRQSINQSHSG